MKRFLLSISFLLSTTGCSSLNLGGPVPERSVRESCCLDEAEIQAATAANECAPPIQQVKLVSTCESCSAFVVSAKTRKSCNK